MTSATSTRTIALARRWTPKAIASIHQPPTAAKPAMAATSNAIATVKRTISATIRVPPAACVLARASLMSGPVALPLPLDLATNVLHRLDRMHGRDDVEVVWGRGRGHEPLERVRPPRIVAGVATLPQADQDVDDRQQHAGREDERPDRADEVLRSP